MRDVILASKFSMTQLSQKIKVVVCSVQLGVPNTGESGHCLIHHTIHIHTGKKAGQKHLDSGHDQIITKIIGQMPWVLQPPYLKELPS